MTYHEIVVCSAIQVALEFFSLDAVILRCHRSPLAGGYTKYNTVSAFLTAANAASSNPVVRVAGLEQWSEGICGCRDVS